MNPSTSEQIVLGGGCFWCLEAAFQQIEGITEVTNGYAGGARPNPTYEQVCTGVTGHAEVVQVSFDTSVISLSDVLDIFFTIHNPTTLNFQGYDKGTEYRSIILYQTEDQEPVARQKLVEVQQLWPEPVVTELLPLTTFWKAEDYHQNYFRTNPQRAYCVMIINPKLAKLREKFATRLRA